MKKLTLNDIHHLTTNIKKRPNQKFSGYWFNLIRFRQYNFIQGNIDDESSEYGIDRNIIALADDITPDDIKGLWLEITGHPVEESEEKLLVQYLSEQNENDVELIVPERKLVRSVEWRRFDDTREYNIYATHIYPAILSIIEKIQSRRLLDLGCGSGNLIETIKTTLPHIDCYGIEISPSNIDAVEDKGMSNIFLGDSEKVNDILSQDLLFDTVIFCGLLNKQVTEKDKAVRILKNAMQRLVNGGYLIITGYSACHLTAKDLSHMGVEVLRKSIPSNIFKDYQNYYLRQLYLGKKL